MLTLTRRPGEKVLIGDDIVIQVVRLKDGRVTLGIEAPPEVTVIREELRREKRGNFRLLSHSKGSVTLGGETFEVEHETWVDDRLPPPNTEIILRDED